MQKTLTYFLACTALIIFSCNNTEPSDDPQKEVHNASTEDTLIDKPQLAIDSSLIVLDNSSNLMWMRKDFGSIKRRYLRNWEEIFQWKDDLNSANYGGFSDWRVPTIKEYRSINRNQEDRKNYRIHFIELDTTNVWGNGAYAFWSQTTPNTNTASYISFIDGFATSGHREKQMASGPWEGIEFSMSVRLVRHIDSL